MGCRARLMWREHWSIRAPESSCGLLDLFGVHGEMESLVLFVGDDWAEDHHDVEVQDEHGPGVAPAGRLPEGVAGWPGSTS